MRVIPALHLGKAEPNPVFLTQKKKKKLPKGNKIGIVNPYTFTSWKTLKTIPNLFYYITVFLNLGVGSFFPFTKRKFHERLPQVRYGGWKKNCLHHLWPGRAHCPGANQGLPVIRCTLWRERGKWILHAEQYHRVIQRTKGLLKGKGNSKRGYIE